MRTRTRCLLVALLLVGCADRPSATAPDAARVAGEIVLEPGLGVDFAVRTVEEAELRWTSVQATSEERDAARLALRERNTWLTPVVADARDGKISEDEELRRFRELLELHHKEDTRIFGAERAARLHPAPAQLADQKRLREELARVRSALLDAP